jgi:hypothetical protein
MSTNQNTNSKNTSPLVRENKEHLELKRELDELKNLVDKQSETLRKIHQAIVGDKEFGQEGLVEMVKKHEDWIQSQKYMWAKIYGGILVGSTTIGYIINQIAKYYMK